jgi:hypothetical protein
MTAASTAPADQGEKVSFDQMLQLQEIELRREYLRFEQQQFAAEFGLRQAIMIREAGCSSSTEFYSVLKPEPAAPAED